MMSITTTATKTREFGRRARVATIALVRLMINHRRRGCVTRPTTMMDHYHQWWWSPRPCLSHHRRHPRCCLNHCNVQSIEDQLWQPPPLVHQSTNSVMSIVVVVVVVLIHSRWSTPFWWPCLPSTFYQHCHSHHSPPFKHKFNLEVCYFGLELPCEFLVGTWPEF